MKKVLLTAAVAVAMSSTATAARTFGMEIRAAAADVSDAACEARMLAPMEVELTCGGDPSYPAALAATMQGLSPVQIHREIGEGRTMKAPGTWTAQTMSTKVIVMLHPLGGVTLKHLADAKDFDGVIVNPVLMKELTDENAQLRAEIIDLRSGRYEGRGIQGASMQSSGIHQGQTMVRHGNAQAHVSAVRATATTGGRAWSSTGNASGTMFIKPLDQKAQRFLQTKGVHSYQATIKGGGSEVVYGPYLGGDSILERFRSSGLRVAPVNKAAVEKMVRL